MAIDLRAFHQTFFDESAEALDVIETRLLGLAAGADAAEAIQTVFRAAHSIKGGAGTFGFGRIAQLTHLMETRLDELRDGRRAVNASIIEALLSAVDALRGLLHSTRAGEPSDASAAKAAEARLLALADSGRAVVEPLAGRGKTWRIVFRPFPELFASGNDPCRILRELRSMGEIDVEVDASRLPQLAEMDPERCWLGWTARLTTSQPVEPTLLHDVFAWVTGECELTIDPVPDEGWRSPNEAPESDSGRSFVAASADTASIRVSTDKIDALVNLVGELVITQSVLSQVGQQFGPDSTAKLLDGLGHLERNTRELQESVMRIRMVPIGFAFSRLPRMVHDVGRQLGKQVELRVSGEQTELDKVVIEKLMDPLVHLVRNALDHGLETPAERRAAGKPETGVVRLNAFNHGSAIVIEVGDDGRGLDRGRIRRTAEARGLLRPGEGVTDDRVVAAIFEPGFSTAAAVTDLSGRGVGMDVVRQNITALGGHIDVRSAEGRGTTFSVRLPLTLAIIDGQLVRIGGRTYVVPLGSIVESLKVEHRRFARPAGGAEVYRVRDDVIPVLRPSAVLNCDDGGAEGGLLMVLASEGRRVGLLVDELLAQQQVVIKSLEANYQQVPCVSGATILGDGAVALILDAPGLVQTAQHGRVAGVGSPGRSLAA